MTSTAPLGIVLSLEGVTINRVEVSDRVIVEMSVPPIPATWLCLHGWDKLRLRASRSQWWDVTVDSLKVRFELAYAEKTNPVMDWWTLRFSCTLPGQKAKVLVYKVRDGKLHDVTVRRAGKQLDIADAREKKLKAKRVTVEGMPEAYRESQALAANSR